jgi:hypothetical protein
LDENRLRVRVIRTGSAPVPLVTHHMKLDVAPEPYHVYDAEGLEIALPP